MLVDASPLIYLAKIDALDVFGLSGHVPLVTPEVETETARQGLGYEHPDSLVIADALRSGVLQRIDLTPDEVTTAGRLLTEAGGIDRGEAEVLAAALGRRQSALLHERRATRVARSIGIDARSPIDVLFAGTADPALLADRIRRLAALVQMRFEDVRALMELIEERER